MPKFPFVWSESQQTFWEPEDVRDHYEQYKLNPNDLRCPDENCRLEYPQTTLIPVCCNPDEPCSKNSPHFRTHTKGIHSDVCLYGTLGEETDYIVNHKKEFCNIFPYKNNILLELNGVKDTSLLADEYIKEFNPHTEVEEIKKYANTYRKNGLQKNESLRMARCKVPHRTSKLEHIIIMAEELEKTKERDKAHLALPGRPNTTYEKAFLSINSLKHNYTTPYIYCGLANIVKKENEYIILYKKQLQTYHPDYPNLFALTLINPMYYRSAFLRELDGYAASGENCYVYSFSAHFLKANNCPLPDISRWILIEPIARDAVVIRNLCLNRPRNRTS